jgi:hypothetical protein
VGHSSAMQERPGDASDSAPPAAETDADVLGFEDSNELGES